MGYCYWEMLERANRLRQRAVQEACDGRLESAVEYEEAADGLESLAASRAGVER